MMEKIKIVGKRRQRETETEKDYDVLLKTMQALRGNRGICPRGVIVSGRLRKQING
ncbi:MAG: hypothetical protein MPW15_23180 [Candidatus Manganitrophus sp.]|nr:hypothetical protein [Candidatus Manganitrophus sp.]